MKALLYSALAALAVPASAQDCTPVLTSGLAPAGDFGAALAAEGDRLVVGAPLGDLTPGGPPLRPYGRAEVFEYDPGSRSWQLFDVVGPSAAPFGNNEGFASRVALAGDVLYCTWPTDFLGGNGTVRPFTRVGVAVGWVPETPILPPVQTATGVFGISVAAHGPDVVIGEMLSGGLAHVYTRSALPGGWVLRQTLSAPPPGPVTGTFGRSVAMQGEWIFVGAPGHFGALHGAGYVYVFRRDPSGVWQPTQRIEAFGSNPLTADGFGSALDAEPGRLFIGANQEISPVSGQSGAVYVYEVDGAGVWTPSQHIVPPGVVAMAGFGSSVDSFHDSLVVGSPLEPGPTGNAQGAAYRYERDPVSNAWQFTGRLVVPSPIPSGSRTGEAVAASAWHVAIGAPGLGQVRATPAYPTRDVDADNALDSCEALHDPTPCPALPNASGFVGRLLVDGTLDVTAAGTRLTADRLTPDSFGYFLVSRSFRVAPPASPANAQLCLGGAIGRFVQSVTNAGPAGRVHLVVDPLQLPGPNGPVAAQPGDTWHFQYWHRDDPAVTGRTTALTETARVRFE